MRSTTLFLCLFCSISIFAQKQIVYIVRHAEKDLKDINQKDPNLSIEGQQRALNLSQILQKDKIDIAYTTPYKRTHQTLEPLVKAKDITLIEYPPQKQKDLVLSILNSKKNAIIAGHSNTILELAKAFGGIPKIKEINEDDYSNLIKLTINGKKVRTKIKKYNNR